MLISNAIKEKNCLPQLIFLTFHHNVFVYFYLIFLFRAPARRLHCYSPWIFISIKKPHCKVQELDLPPKNCTKYFVYVQFMTYSCINLKIYILFHFSFRVSVTSIYFINDLNNLTSAIFIFLAIFYNTVMWSPTNALSPVFVN